MLWCASKSSSSNRTDIDAADQYPFCGINSPFSHDTPRSGHIEQRKPLRENKPSVQGWQSVPFVGVYVPGAHGVQWWAPSVDSLPPGHTSHSAAPPELYVPLPHGVHSTAPEAAASPAGHGAHAQVSFVLAGIDPSAHTSYVTPKYGSVFIHSTLAFPQSSSAVYFISTDIGPPMKGGNAQITFKIDRAPI